MLGPPSFNIYLNDLFTFVTDCKICNFVDDTTIYVCDGNHENVINKSESETLLISEWFRNNYMKLNDDKCHLMLIKIGSTTIIESREDKLLGVTLDKQLSSKTHVQSLCKKASQKLHALSRISHLLGTEKLKHIMRALSYPNLATAPWFGCSVTDILITRSIPSTKRH